MSQNEHPIFSPIKEEIICFHKATQTELIDSTLPYHRHDAYEIYLFLRGNTCMYLEHSRYFLKPGDLVIISPCEMHRCICIDNQTYERIGLNIKKTTLEKLSSPRSNLLSCFESHLFGRNNLTRLSQEQISVYTTLIHQLMGFLRSSGYGQDVLAKACLMQILVFVNNVYKAPACGIDNLMPKLVSRTMSFVKEHLTEPISSEQLEREFHYSGKYIGQLFKEHTGLTIRSYIVDQRISLAKRHLSAGKTVAEACELSGFSDYANFIRSFKKIVGMPPGKYKIGELQANLRPHSQH